MKDIFKQALYEHIKGCGSISCRYCGDIPKDKKIYRRIARHKLKQNLLKEIKEI